MSVNVHVHIHPEQVAKVNKAMTAKKPKPRATEGSEMMKNLAVAMHAARARPRY